ncbi:MULTISPECIES: tryptophan--tRNA ligase [Pseudothermotoga]|uniref:Tryptophan--tRNA ligase n=1 Tax=Pseudothermotoga lettingae (strain ATCC BAA-301 / DSM 14385 / NBRC 107922 / TMO) TaxID=416591 RepID=A8F7D7_PSELT|nr:MULTISPECIES: tryptophan--tRNA ligase [Pseudothermotoga]ABV34071.1 tryptophanyl-tRNA synthetase [Pseudothermotoga lettingae TMO]MDI3494684.1 tryptophanyl-tRNA synthetase [Pseudothermotoga sp.]MDK2884696.1 tryptophanyl-tRNA synthetase [Pseudothermotoga sp.]GLI48990.1 tryptophan--tRNA ligase [Pseudothermotoga lettingae TMO]HBJ81285.1 tryptophan--tRNA ligase [Pseudothermotoga sp.]
MRILSGVRPTGKPHVGNYIGALKNWKKLQEEGNECFYFVADWHALTTAYSETDELKTFTREVMRSFLACGLNPEKSILFVQSAIKEHSELALLFSMIVPISWLERVPTYKEMRQQLSDKDLSNAGFLLYPVLQAADILMYLAEGVPVGEDQTYHVELTREIARRFNYIYGETFPEPKTLLSIIPKLPGTDGRKMSKSYGNTIPLENTLSNLEKSILPMMTDPARKRRTDPGNPEKCPVWDYHKAFEINDEESQWVIEGCTKAKIGCIDCKKLLIKNMKKELEPIWIGYAKIDSDPHYVDDIMEEGNKRARFVAQNTMNLVREKMHLLF